jgi:hypothetical protein
MAEETETQVPAKVDRRRSSIQPAKWLTKEYNTQKASRRMAHAG